MYTLLRKLVGLLPGKVLTKPARAALAFFLTFLMAAAGPAGAAANATAMVTIQASAPSAAVLTLGATTITFPDASPDTVPSIHANENPVSVEAYAQTNGQKSVTLTVLAHGDLVAGSNTIPISNVTWTATGTGYQAGTMNKTTGQPAGSWAGSGDRFGTFSFLLKNSWSYATGNYSQTVTYTLTAP